SSSCPSSWVHGLYSFSWYGSVGAGHFCKVVEQMGGGKLLDNGWFVRDVKGSLALIIPDEPIFGIDLVEIRKEVSSELGAYCHIVPENLIRRCDHSYGESGHLALPEYVDIGGGVERKVKVIDQRSNGQDWLSAPNFCETEGERPPRLVFWSLKGGVGRTTALTVLAANLAANGLNVLVVDLDLEAPGVGDQLLRQQDKPRFGVLDFLSELRVGEIDVQSMLINAVGTSSLTQGRGLVHVCPAAGAQTYENPNGFLSKLFRAYGNQEIDGVTKTFAERINMLIDGLCSLSRYDAVLIDARAGLSESTAASILNLGGDVLLFGHNTPQTFSGYRYAFAHLSRFVLNGDLEWILRIKMVHAKAGLSRQSQELFRDSAFEIFSSYLYVSDDDEESFSLEDLEAPHSPWVILDDGNFRDFNPVENPEMLGSSVANSAFGDFIASCKERLRV
ncbi:ParA family protein, partial [Xanthomonas campestris]